MGFQSDNHANGRMHTLKSRRICEWIFCLVILISFWAAPEAQALQVSPTSLNFLAVQGATIPPNQTVSFSKNNIKRALSWTITDNATWLSVTPMSGTITDTAQIAVSVNTSGLAAGSYSAAIIIAVNKGGSVSVPVTLTLTAATSTPSTSITSSTSTTATLSWIASTSTDVAGYKVYFGTASSVYDPPIAVGNTTTFVVNNLQSGNTYYFSVTAYDTVGNESLHSNEVSKSIY